MFIRTREKNDNGTFIERTEEAEDYNKTIHYEYGGTESHAYLVSYHPKSKNILRRFWVSCNPAHQPPEKMKWVNEIYVMNDQGKTIEVISN